MGKKRNVPYPAVYGGRRYNINRHEWARMLGCSEQHISKGLRLYGDMQTFIDAKFNYQQRVNYLMNKFLYSKPISCGGVDDKTRVRLRSPCSLLARVALTKNYGDNVCL